MMARQTPSRLPSSLLLTTNLSLVSCFRRTSSVAQHRSPLVRGVVRPLPRILEGLLRPQHYTAIAHASIICTYFSRHHEIVLDDR